MPNHTEPKKILCIHDLSSLGRCSLAVITPTLCAMGYQAVPLPTMLLSTHTGGLGTPATARDDAFGSAALAHYASLGVSFDCIYTGYLGGMAGVSLAKEAFALFPDAYKVVDPVMGDHGKAYSSITPDFMDAMRLLSAEADLILPNYTEAHLLLQQPYPAGEVTSENATAAQALAAQLCADYPTRSVVITGVPTPHHIGCAGAQRGNPFWVRQRKLNRSFPGTGDLFGAALIGALLHGNALSAASEGAAAFVANAIQNTPEDADTRFGVCFEPLLKNLMLS